MKRLMEEGVLRKENNLFSACRILNERIEDEKVWPKPIGKMHPSISSASLVLIGISILPSCPGQNVSGWEYFIRLWPVDRASPLAGGCHLSAESPVGCHSIAQWTIVESRVQDTRFLCGHAHATHANAFQILVLYR